MRNIASRLTFVFAALNVATGILITQFLTLFNVRQENVDELRWVLILGMPVLMFVSYFRIARVPVEDKTILALQIIGLVALFLAPYVWILRHSQNLPG